MRYRDREHKKIAENRMSGVKPAIRNGFITIFFRCRGLYGSLRYAKGARGMSDARRNNPDDIRSKLALGFRCDFFSVEQVGI